MASERQIAANRENGKMGGPKTPEGKAVSRMNARKHGIFGSALTEYDAEELHGVYEEFAASIRPVGPIEESLVQQLALVHLRIQRCALAEAQYHIATWEPWEEGDPKARPNAEGKPVHFDFERMEESVRLFGRYNVTLTNQFLKLLQQIERIQKMRATAEGGAAPVRRAPAETAGPQFPAEAAGPQMNETNPISPVTLPARDPRNAPDVVPCVVGTLPRSPGEDRGTDRNPGEGARCETDPNEQENIWDWKRPRRKTIRAEELDWGRLPNQCRRR